MTSQYIQTVLAAGSTTLLVALASLLLATLIGLSGALAKQSEHRALRAVATAYTFLVRGIPDLVVMLLIFYSLPALINQVFEAVGVDSQVEFSATIAGIASLGIIFGAYMTETFKTALQNIPRGQIEAAHAYGMSAWQTFHRIVIPQLIRLALPGFANNWLVLAKGTALVSLIGLQDVMFRAKGAAEATGKPFTFYLVAATFYLFITLISMATLGVVAKRYSVGERGLSH
ncbi:amino acid ABC transporter permease [Rhizobium altiplani]|uniref:Amino acid ABC transporter permease n=1 Tax=Rhizobium altiplani TaxID=1864509 RepID=A0A109JRI9_9HYPH|nr:ABC transporter permease subunit [Rhizobium altiplani]KWV53668.1 amino acid ABC transporter permease [Rhizobium altiplani]